MRFEVEKIFLKAVTIEIFLKAVTFHVSKLWHKNVKKGNLEVKNDKTSIQTIGISP